MTNSDEMEIYPKHIIDNQRTKALIIFIISILFLFLVVMRSFFISEANLATNMEVTSQAPSLAHPFGTDWLGRDVYTRTLAGLRISLIVGAVASAISTVIGVGLGLLSSIHPLFDSLVDWLINLFLTVPYIVVAILVSVIMGRGFVGIIIAIGITHWAPFARLVRSRTKEIMSSSYIEVSKKLGHHSVWIARQHILPQLIPLIFLNLTLTFPQAILHEAELTLLGFGLPPHRPAIGIILAESIQSLSSGEWWLIVFPGLSLLLVVLAIQQTGENIRKLMDPHILHE